MAGLIIGAMVSHDSVRWAVIGYAVMTALSYAWYFRIIMYSIRENNQLPLGIFKPSATVISKT